MLLLLLLYYLYIYQTLHELVNTCPVKCRMTFLIHFQRLLLWSLEKIKWFHPALYSWCNYLSVMGLRFLNIWKETPRVEWFNNFYTTLRSHSSKHTISTNSAYFLVITRKILWQHKLTSELISLICYTQNIPKHDKKLANVFVAVF